MRSLSLLFMVLLSACGGGLGPLFAEVRWAVRCEAMGGCVGSSSHDVVGNNGEGGVALRCDVVESPTSRTISLSVTETDLDGFRIDGAQVPLAGGPAGGGCRA